MSSKPSYAWVMFVSLCSLAGSGAAQQKELRKLRMNVFTAPDAGTVAARARGDFTAAGIELDITVTVNSTQQMRGLGSGAYDIVSTAFDNVLAWSGKEGAQILAVAQRDSGVELPVFVRPEIRDWRDLRGRKLAVDAVDTAFALVLRRILLQHGLHLDQGDYQLAAVGAGSQRLESMTRGETFAGILNPPLDEQAASLGLIRMGDHRGVLPDYPGGVYAVSRDWAQRNREEVTRFLVAWLAGVRWVRDPANRDAAVKLVATDLKLSSKAAAERIDQLSATGSLNLAGLESVLDLRRQFGFTLPLGPALAAYYDRSYLETTQR